MNTRQFHSFFNLCRNLIEILFWFIFFVQVANQESFCKLCKSKQKQFHVQSLYTTRKWRAGITEVVRTLIFIAWYNWIPRTLCVSIAIKYWLNSKQELNMVGPFWPFLALFDPYIWIVLTHDKFPRWYYLTPQHLRNLWHPLLQGLV